MNEDTWEARMAARARARRPPPAETVDYRIGRKCTTCGHEENHSLRYGNLKTGAAYCSEECFRHDPEWSENMIWLA